MKCDFRYCLLFLRKKRSTATQEREPAKTKKPICYLAISLRMGRRVGRVDIEAVGFECEAFSSMLGSMAGWLHLHVWLRCGPYVWALLSVSVSVYQAPAWGCLRWLLLIRLPVVVVPACLPFSACRFCEFVGLIKASYRRNEHPVPLWRLSLQ